ncbi:MAG: glycosyltransferase family 2 protein [Candidatus Beckwithbacteria bacterium]|nr:glycosyltransferase family 2 protein [Candidatus Beckwithbacteria bacterium]
MKLSVIIPSFNEAGTIRQIITKVKKLTKISPEIIVVNDGSTDTTKKIIAGISGIKTINLSKNQGKGAAIRAGLKQVTGDYVLIQDADLEYDPEDIKLLLTPVLNNQAAVVYGSRFLGPHRNMLFWHLAGNRFLSFLTNLFYNTTISDMEVGYKLFPKKLLLSLDLKENRFGFEPEVTSKILKQGIRIYEVPISYSGREFCEGKKITWVDGLQAFYLLCKYRLV